MTELRSLYDIQPWQRIENAPGKDHMNNPQTAMEQFESEYGNELAMLAERRPDGESIDALLVVEENRPNLGGLASVMPQAIGPALVRAVRMGYAEGYVAAKDD